LEIFYQISLIEYQPGNLFVECECPRIGKLRSVRSIFSGGRRKHRHPFRVSVAECYQDKGVDDLNIPIVCANFNPCYSISHKSAKRGSEISRRYIYLFKRGTICRLHESQFYESLAASGTHCCGDMTRLCRVAVLGFEARAIRN
jgi:hypothetical protein